MLKWYGHVMRRNEEYVGKRMMRIDVEGRWRKGRLTLKWRWMDNVNAGLRGKGLSGEETQNRVVWTETGQKHRKKKWWKKKSRTLLETNTDFGNDNERMQRKKRCQHGLNKMRDLLLFFSVVPRPIFLTCACMHKVEIAHWSINILSSVVCLLRSGIAVNIDWKKCGTFPSFCWLWSAKPK